jgi:hypothetical protein
MNNEWQWERLNIEWAEGWAVAMKERGPGDALDEGLRTCDLLWMMRYEKRWL